ncbi:hypothetical protein PIB30_022499 [Stylosanthes scabra]|uniref:Uncharacterized protein n=1 Tax=Stylosanthes scabra TaxID=79078 RepID=A0ABU6UB27_9FABA|nr:hypothetical protein [Stylosanthes scabra]
MGFGTSGVTEGTKEKGWELILVNGSVQRKDRQIRIWGLRVHNNWGLVGVGLECPTFPDLSFDVYKSGDRLSLWPGVVLPRIIGRSIVVTFCLSKRVLEVSGIRSVSFELTVDISHIEERGGERTHPLDFVDLLGGDSPFLLSESSSSSSSLLSFFKWSIIRSKEFKVKMAENPDSNPEAVAATTVQISHELSPLYRWVSPDVLGAPSALNQAYLDELKATRIIFGGGDLERRYKVEVAHRGERVCFMNLQHPTVPHWLWVNEVMFTKFGVRVTFTDFQQRLLNRSCIAPSQLHLNAWASIRCFELVVEWLELPQEPEVFMTLFTFYSSNTSGKTKKGYILVRPAKGRKIFGLFEDSFHDFKGRYFKILPVGTHRPFWLSLEGDGRFPSYWTDKAGFDVAPVTYKGLRADQKDTIDVLTVLFHKNNLAPKALLGRPEEARRDV